jgi:PAS domain-containing protein
MKPLHDLPIRRKVMLVMMLTTGLALLLACTALLSYELREYRHRLERDLTTLAKVIAANSAAAVSFDDAEAAAEMLAALKAEPQIVGARIYRQSGEPLAEYLRPEARAPLPGTPGSSGFSVANDRLHYFGAIEDVREQTPTGTLYLVADFVGLRERVKSYAGLLAMVLVAAGIVAFALSAKLQSYISDPVLKLAETARKISDEGNYSLRAVRETEDEIGDLIVSFNEMLAQIQQRDEALHSAHDTLERRVKERTAELQQEVIVRAKAEEDLARSLSLVTATLEATADGILVVDGDGQVMSYNQKFVSMWRIPTEVLDGGHGSQLLSSVRGQLKDPDAYLAKVEALSDDLSTPSHDIIEFHDGRVFERYSQPHRVHGLTVGRVWSFRDITARTKPRSRSVNRPACWTSPRMRFSSETWMMWCSSGTKGRSASMGGKRTRCSAARWASSSTRMQRDSSKRKRQASPGTSGAVSSRNSPKRGRKWWRRADGLCSAMPRASQSRSW